jgi:hypothetical protein
MNFVATLDAPSAAGCCFLLFSGSAIEESQPLGPDRAASRNVREPAARGGRDLRLAYRDADA